MSFDANVQQPIETTLEVHAKQARAAVRNGRIVGAIGLALMACWLTWLHGQISQLDAEGMATLAGERAKAELPHAAEMLRAKLEEAAPQLVATAKDKLLDAPTQLRKKLESQADEWIASAIRDLDKGFSEHLAGDVEAARVQLAERYPGLDDRAQIRALMHDYAADYGVQIVAMIGAPAGDTDRITRGVAEQIEHLALSQNLSEKEKLQRELLVTLCQLVPRLQTSEEVGGFSLSWADLSQRWLTK